MNDSRNFKRVDFLSVIPKKTALYQLCDLLLRQKKTLSVKNSASQLTYLTIFVNMTKFELEIVIQDIKYFALKQKNLFLNTVSV